MRLDSHVCVRVVSRLPVVSQAEKQLAGWEAQLKEGQHWSEVAGGGKKGGFRLWA